MLQAPIQPFNYSLRARRKAGPQDLLYEGDEADFGSSFEAQDNRGQHSMADLYDEDLDEGKGGKGKSRRELPPGAVATLKAWLLSPEHFSHPYPTPQDQAMLMQKTGIDKKQLKNWFTNARRRIWKPMLKKQIESGQLSASAGVPGAVPGLLMSSMPGGGGVTNGTIDNPHSAVAVRAHYQQAARGKQETQQVSPPWHVVFLLLHMLLPSSFCFYYPGSCPTRLIWKPNVPVDE